MPQFAARHDFKRLNPCRHGVTVFGGLGPGFGVVDDRTKSHQEHIGKQVTGVVMGEGDARDGFEEAGIGRLAYGVSSLKLWVFKVVSIKDHRYLYFI